MPSIPFFLSCCCCRLASNSNSNPESRLCGYSKRLEIDVVFRERNKYPDFFLCQKIRKKSQREGLWRSSFPEKGVNKTLFPLHYALYKYLAGWRRYLTRLKSDSGSCQSKEMLLTPQAYSHIADLTNLQLHSASLFLFMNLLLLYCQQFVQRNFARH